MTENACAPVPEDDMMDGGGETHDPSDPSDPIDPIDQGPVVLSETAIEGVRRALPSVASLSGFISLAQRFPMLTLQEEQFHGRRLMDQQCADSASALVTSHLRQVIAMSRSLAGYNLSQEDLIQVGVLGLIKAVQRFDPDRGIRLASYAGHWIRSEMQEFVVRNCRLVKPASTASQRKLFFNLRSMKQKLRGSDAGRGLSAAEASQIAAALDVKDSEVLEMDVRLSGGDYSLQAQDPSDQDGDSIVTRISELPDERITPEAQLLRVQHDWMTTEGLKQALSALDPRSRRIVESRWLAVGDDGSGGPTLAELAQEYGVSSERIRQIEARAMRTMREVVTAAMLSASDLIVVD